MQKRNIRFLWILLLLFPAAPHATAQSESFSEYDIQAAYISKFIPFVEWPQEKIDRETITIGILGKTPFGDAFRELEGQRIGKHTVVIKHLDSRTDYQTLGQCQVLYISASEKRKLPAILKAIETLPILTVSDSKRFVEKGGMIGFLKKKSRLAFEINNTSVKKAQLEIRSTLKRIALRVINPKGSKGGGHDE